MGWVKINFDGVEKDDLGPLGCGGLLRGDNGVFILVVVLPLGSHTNHLVEVVAVHHGLNLAYQLNYKKIWLKRDS